MALPGHQAFGRNALDSGHARRSLALKAAMPIAQIAQDRMRIRMAVFHVRQIIDAFQGLQ